ncbi:MAG: c-type cytochrome [Planctomycetaceae bacterium]|nr:c-type cytochrome [Planctomycetaceae bacterium]
MIRWLVTAAAVCSLATADEVKIGAPTSAAEWHRLQIPDAWRRVPAGPRKPVDGYSWYRCDVRIPPDWTDGTIQLSVEALDDARVILINGTTAGAIGSLPPVYRSGLGATGRFSVEKLLRPGKVNTLAIRVFQDDPRPNFSVAPPVLVHRKRQEGIRLSGEWLYRPGDDPAWATQATADAPTFETVEAVPDVERFIAQRAGDRAALSPQAALDSFELADDLQLELVLSEPEISQPLFMAWDARGRLWVMEYRQYPDVAGVSMVSRDVYLRSVYDRVPEPPPFGAAGRDRISIHEDTTGDGRLDSHTTFVDGLNIATSFAIGRGGVFVTNPPYLLFYPDLDGDDVPDGDPQVLLEGFGLEDSHSVINSLRFGPDGWLYGAQGSTVSAAVRQPGSRRPAVQTMGQQIWRYHPERRTFEVFAEGGGNTFGCEIDSVGNIFSGHNGGDTRGFHYVQGGYSRKGFGKHGPLSNPYAFGYFSAMKHHKVARFTHNFIIYEDRQLPPAYRGRLFGIEPLQGQIVLSDVWADGTSFQTKDVSRVLKTDDPWFRPVDIKTGPDGAVYVADMYEQRIDHSSHYAGRIDRRNGRIYRLRGRQPLVADVGDQQRMSSEALMGVLAGGTRTQRQTALRVLGDRRDGSLTDRLDQMVFEATGQLAREYLWALHQSGGLSETRATRLLAHVDPFVRGWVVQLLGNRKHVGAATVAALRQLAADEAYPFVRRQLAASSRRLPAADAIPIVRQLLSYDEDANDVHQPLMLWWAIERHLSADVGRTLVQSLLASDADVVSGRLYAEHIAQRLIRRYVQSGTRAELLAATRLLQTSGDEVIRRQLAVGFETAVQGRSLNTIPAELMTAVVATGHASSVLRMRTGDQAAIDEAQQDVRQKRGTVSQRSLYLETFGELGTAQAKQILLAALDDSDERLLAATLTALGHYNEPQVAREILQRLPGWSSETGVVAETVLSSRADWSLSLLKAVSAGQVARDQISAAAVRRMLLHDRPMIHETVATIWGTVQGATTAQMKAETLAVTATLAEGSGNPRTGKRLFVKNCGRCHRLFEEGGDVGPDLTSFQRTDLSRMLPNIINPSLEIREGYENHQVVTVNGRLFNGFLTDQDDRVVLLRSVDGSSVTLPRDEIDNMSVSPVSIMPEGTLRSLSPQQLRDLFAYLRSSQPVNY